MIAVCIFARDHRVFFIRVKTIMIFTSNKIDQGYCIKELKKSVQTFFQFCQLAISAAALPATCPVQRAVVTLYPTV